jgi:hypothetical protein
MAPYAANLDQTIGFFALFILGRSMARILSTAESTDIK